MKMAIYMKCYIDAVDSVSAFCLHQDFILTKLNEIMSRGERRNEGDTQTPKRTTPQPPHWSPQYSVRICSVSFLYSAWAHYKAKCSKSGVEHLNSPSYLKLLGFTTHKHGVLFIQQEQEEQELCYADVQIILLLCSFSTFFHQVNPCSLHNCSSQLLCRGLKLHSLYTFLPRVRDSKSRWITACSQLPMR